MASEGWGSTVETAEIKTLDLGSCLLPKLSIPQFKAHLPFICTSINPGQMITLLQSICTSALTCSSQKIIRGSIIFPSRTQRSSVIISLSLKSRQFLNWYNFGCLSCVLFILYEEITVPSCISWYSWSDAGLIFLKIFQRFKDEMNC